MASLATLASGTACGSNPEIAVGTGSVDGGADVGESCSATRGCLPSLSCVGGKCVGSCTDDPSMCGGEACLPSGRCSQGLGRDCQGDDDCRDGLACSQQFKRCSLTCDPGDAEGCPGDKPCREDGTCPTDRDIDLGGVGGAGSGEGPGGEGGSSSCIDLTVKFEEQVPTVLLLIDRSGSMNAGDGFGDAVEAAVSDGSYTLGDCPSHNDWRWNVVRDVLFNETKGIVRPLEDRVRFGLSLYSSDDGRRTNGGMLDPNKTCPELINVELALANTDDMLEKFQCDDIFEDTPTRESLEAAADTLVRFEEPGPKIIVLATDGEPDDCDCPDTGAANECTSARSLEIKDEVVASAQSIHDDNDITVHVINVSTPTNASLQEHLAAVAKAGGGNVYPGFSPGDLTQAFEEIIDGVRSCVIDLDGEIAKGKESTGTVTLDGRELELDGDDGWRVNTPSQIELLGEACETLKSGTRDLDIKFPCESFEPVVH